VVEAQIVFVKGPDGKVSILILRQNGQNISMARLSNAESGKILAANAAKDAIAKKRYEKQKPAEGSEAAIRKDIADIEAGTPAYDEPLANATRQQLPRLKTLFAQLGAIRPCNLSVSIRTVPTPVGSSLNMALPNGISRSRLKGRWICWASAQSSEVLGSGGPFD